MGSSELGPIYRRTGHPSSCRPRHTDRVVGWWSEEPRLTARIRRRHTRAALSAVRAVHKSDFRTAGNAHQISVRAKGLFRRHVTASSSRLQGMSISRSPYTLAAHSNRRPAVVSSAQPLLQ